MHGKMAGSESQGDHIGMVQLPKVRVRPTDPKGALEYDIEMERDKI